MKTFSVCLGLLMAFSLQAQMHKRVLFIGNSYTAYNNLPQLVERLAQSNGDTVYWESTTPGGFRLQQHASAAGTLQKIRQGNWDYVVIQAQSQEPSFSPGQVAAQTLPFAKALADSVYAHNPCAKPVYYMTWGRKNGDQRNCGVYPPSCTYEGMQGRLRASYLLMAQENNGLVAAVGSAWYDTRQQHSNIELYTADQSHPSYAGSYLAAASIYATLFQKTPTTATFYGTLADTTAQKLQQRAATAVLAADSMTLFRVGIDDIKADFTHQVQDDSIVTFTETGAHATSWHWDFGDGQTATTANPTHTYKKSNTYTVRLIVENACQTDTLTKTLTINLPIPSATTEVAAAQVEIYPNPTQGLCYLNSTSTAPMQIRIYDMLGRLQHAEDALHFPHSIQLDLPKGLYTLTWQNATTQGTQKLLVQP